MGHPAPPQAPRTRGGADSFRGQIGRRSSAEVTSASTQTEQTLSATRALRCDRSDINKHLVSVAAPIFVAPETVVGSLVLVRLKKEVDAADLARLTKLAIGSARKVSDGVQAL
jgi:DNA-binding IclR family transcriptional regulator